MDQTPEKSAWASASETPASATSVAMTLIDCLASTELHGIVCPLGLPAV
jgi:hypothetical protein